MLFYVPDYHAASTLDRGILRTLTAMYSGNRVCTWVKMCPANRSGGERGAGGGGVVVSYEIVHQILQH